MTTKNILVTGGTGLVGSAIQRVSTDNEHSDNNNFFFLSSNDCNLENYEDTLDFFKNFSPDYVIHLAACVGGLYKNMNYKVDMFEKNVLINFNVLRCCYATGVKKVVCCLSTCIFPDKTSYPINETMLHNGPPHFSNDAYAYAKRMLEIQCKAYNEQYGTNYVCVIPTNVYGPNDNYSLEDGHVIPALIHRCFLNKNAGEKFSVRGTGAPLRQFIYSDDLARLMLWVLYSYNELDSIILSVSEKDEVSIKTIAREIAKAYDYEDMLEFDTSFSDGQFKKTADNSKLMRLYGDYDFMSINDGIKNSVKWFIDNYDNNFCRK